MGSGARRFVAVAALLMGALVVVALGGLFPRLPLRLFVPCALAVLVSPGAVVLARSGAGATSASDAIDGGAPLLVAGAALGALLAPATWTIAHPIVHVDNATGASIQLWIDGARGPILPPGRADAEPPHLRVAAGDHLLGWSRPGEDAPREATKTSVWPLYDHLYNPARAGCYWIEAAAYGGATTLGTPHGPQRVASFYRFDHVDLWFSRAPARVRVARLFRGAQRIAVQRYDTCMQLGALGCETAEKAGFVACQRAFTGPGEPVDCASVARALCSAAAVARSHAPK